MTKDTGIVSIHGKEYQTVAYRIKTFWTDHADYSIETEILHADTICVRMKAVIRDKEGKIRATGHSEEVRTSTAINKTSAVENAETSAIGRALACLGLGGTEFATADEVAHAITEKAEYPQMKTKTVSKEPLCPKCSGKMWDNRLKKASGAMKETAPDYKCKDKLCDGVYWPGQWPPKEVEPDFLEIEGDIEPF